MRNKTTEAFIVCLVAGVVIAGTAPFKAPNHRVRRQTKRCTENAVLSSGQCHCKENMIKFKKDNRTFCEKVPSCGECMGTKYVAGSWFPYDNYDGKPVVCTYPPPGQYAKHGNFKKCRRGCHQLEVEIRGCSRCHDRLCHCPKGIYRDGNTDCTKTCSRCTSPHHATVSTGECDSMPEDMRCYDSAPETTVPLVTIPVTNPKNQSRTGSNKTKSSPVPTNSSSTTTKSTKSINKQSTLSIKSILPSTKSKTPTVKRSSFRVTVVTPTLSSTKRSSSATLTTTNDPTTTKTPTTAPTIPTIPIEIPTTVPTMPATPEEELDEERPDREKESNSLYPKILVGLVIFIAIVVSLSALFIVLGRGGIKRLLTRWQEWNSRSSERGHGYKMLPNNIKDRQICDWETTKKDAFISLFDRICKAKKEMYCRRRLKDYRRIRNALTSSESIINYLETQSPDYTVDLLIKDLRDCGVSKQKLDAFADQIADESHFR